MKKAVFIAVVFVFLPSFLWPVNGREVGRFNGIRVLEVWGTNREMGRALAWFQGDDIIRIVDSLRTFGDWPRIEKMVESYAWDADQLEILQALAAGVPGVGLKELKALNTYGDWS